MTGNQANVTSVRDISEIPKVLAKITTDGDCFVFFASFFQAIAYYVLSAGSQSECYIIVL